MQPKAHVVDGVTFVATPYRAGTFIREDVFWRQFTITCQGQVEYVEETPSTAPTGCLPSSNSASTA